MSGCTIGAKGVQPNIKMFGAEPEADTEAMKACRKDGKKNGTVKVRFDGCGAYAASKRY